MDDSDLHRLLDANLLLPPEYGDGLTSHLPMALQALHALGAGSQRLLAFNAAYAERFHDSRAADAASPAGHTGAVQPLADWRDWRDWRGKPDGFAALRTTFAAAIAADGAAALLQRVLPGLLPGVATAAFHGAIRTAHAVESGHAGELAAALAYWAWRWQPLPPPAPAPLRPAEDAPQLPFDAWAASLFDTAALARFDGRLISRRLQAAAASAVCHRLAGALAPTPALLSKLSAQAAAWYAGTGNFTVLHMLTGLRALRVLLRCASADINDACAADTRALVVRAFVAALLAAGVDPGRAPLADATAAASWSDVVTAATASSDDHVVKLVHAARAEARAYGVDGAPSPYLQAALRAVG